MPAVCSQPRCGSSTSTAATFGADELEAFLAAHEADLKAFTDRGGRLFLNSAPSEGDGMSYDGRQLFFGGNLGAFEYGSRRGG